MTGFKTPPSAKRIKVLGLSETARKAEGQAQFGKSIQESDLAFLAGNGLQDAAHRALNCMGWIWRQWLLGAEKHLLSRQVEPFVTRGLEFRDRTRSYDYLALHDLYLLHCAIFASSDSQLKTVAERLADGSGDKGSRPKDVGHGELYVAAWCGMMKYWILGDDQRAIQHADLIWGAYRQSGVLAASKALVLPWLTRDWSAFRKSQQKDFDKLWNRARKDRWTVKAEDSTEVIVTTERYQIGHQWCWAHCGMALLAYRQGAEVLTDSFWFPPAAVGDAAGPKSKDSHDRPDQMRMF